MAVDSNAYVGGGPEERVWFAERMQGLSEWFKWGTATEWNGRESGFVGSAGADAGGLHGRNGPAR